MAYTFHNPQLTQIHEDFAFRTKDFESYMGPAFADIKTAFDAAKSDKEKAQFSDDMTYLVSACAEKFAAGLDEAAPAYKAQWAKKLSNYMLSAIEFNPQNTPELLDGALRIEKASNTGNCEVLLPMAEKIIFAYAEQKNKTVKQSNEAIKQTKAVLTRLIKHWQNYDKSNAATCAKFYAICEKAYPIVPSILPVANEMDAQTKFLQNDYKLDKDVQTISQNPQDESLWETFESHLKTALRHNPQQAVDDLSANLKNISRIDNAETRNEMYCMIFDALQDGIPAANEAEAKEKSGLIFTVVGKAMKTEKDTDSRESMALAALGLICQSAVDKNGALLIAKEKEAQTFGALDKIAAICGHRSEIQQMLSDTAAKYENDSRLYQMVKETTMKALDSADDSGKKMQDFTEPEFIKELRGEQRSRRAIRQHNNEICELLNISYPSGSDYKYDASKPLKPSKKDLQKAADILGQYQSVDTTLLSLMLNKIDDKEFSNVDDKVLDTFAKATERLNTNEPEVHQKYEGIITTARKQLHTHILENKKTNTEATPPRYVEKRENKEQEPKFVIKFSKDDIKEA